MSLEHNFFLLPERKVLYKNYGDYSAKKSTLKIHDDIIRYINDTLLWVPTLNPAQSQKSVNYGLNLYGSTIINYEGATLFYKIIRLWSELFSLGFVNIELTGAWTVDINEEGIEGEGYYQKIEVPRDLLVTSFATLTSYAEQSIRGDYFILHIGG